MPPKTRELCAAVVRAERACIQRDRAGLIGIELQRVADAVEQARVAGGDRAGDSNARFTGRYANPCAPIDSHGDGRRTVQHGVLAAQDDLAGRAGRDHANGSTRRAPGPRPLTRTSLTPGTAESASRTAASSSGRQTALTCGPASIVKNTA